VNNKLSKVSSFAPDRFVLRYKGASNEYVSLHQRLTAKIYGGPS
jgi:hypothetical protein